MKVSILLTTLFVFLGTTDAFWPFTYSNSNSLIEAWDSNDLQNYLTDNAIAFKKKSSYEELKKLAQETWAQKQLELNQLKKETEKKSANSWSSGYGFEGFTQKVLGRPKQQTTVDKLTGSYTNVKNWVFNTWSSDDLKHLLKKTGVKYDEKKIVTRSQLVKLASDSYDEIAKSLNASGNYAGDWLYSTWDTKSLKKWLKDHDVDYSSFKDNRESLLRKVREHSYEASLYANDQRDSILEQLDLTSKEIFDKAGSIKDEFFNSWSSSQLYNWLKVHKINVEENLKENKDELLLIAKKNKDELTDDIKSWSLTASKSASPYLSKATSSVDNLINDTFFVGIEGWSRDRLRSFLDSRNVPVPHFATKWQLIQLVKENKFKPITNFNNNEFFKGWTRKNIQDWLNEQGDNASDASKNIASKSEEFYKQFLNNLEFYKNKVQDTASEYVDTASSAIVGKTKETKSKSFLDYWSESDLREYLQSFGVVPREPTTKEQLITLAKDNTRWFISGDTYDQRVSNLSVSSRNWISWIHYKIKEVRNWLYHSVFSPLF